MPVVNLRARKNNSIQSGAATTVFNGTTLQLNRTVGGIRDNLLFEFVLAVPLHSVITVATLNLQIVSGPTPKNLTTKKLLPEFIEAEATFNIYSTDNDWTLPGAESDDDDAISVVTGSMPSSGQYAVNILAHAQDALANTDRIIRLIMTRNNDGGAHIIDSRTGTVPPVLTVTYTTNKFAVSSGPVGKDYTKQLLTSIR